MCKPESTAEVFALANMVKQLLGHHTYRAPTTYRPYIAFKEKL